MPRHDPTPRDESARTAAAWARYKKLMRWMVLVSAAAAALAVIYVSATMEHVPVVMLLATIGGVGFSVLLGTALMGLVYFSNNSGHDETAAPILDEVDDRR